MFDRLPTPWGLVRAGVAPDHPEHQGGHRASTRRPPRIPGFRFFGNVEIGTRPHARRPARALPRRHLRGRRADRPAHGHPGRGPARQLGRHRVRRLVQRPPRLPRPRVRPVGRDAPWSSATATSRSTCARMLALTREELAETDVADHALEVLAESQIREIVVLGRRGPAQAAFTNPELLELGELTDADVVVDPGRRGARPAPPARSSRARPRTTTATRTSRSCTSYCQARAGGQAARGSSCASSSRRSRSSASERVEGIGIVRNELVADERGADPRPRHRQHEDDPLRARVPLDRLPRRPRSPAFRSTSRRA